MITDLENLLKENDNSKLTQYFQKAENQKLFNSPKNTIEILNRIYETENTELLNYLLGNKKFNININNCSFLMKVCRHNKTKLLSCLINKKNVDIKYDFNLALRTAAKKNHIDSFKMLLEDERVNIRAKNNEVLRTATYKNYIDLALFIIKDKTIKITSNSHIAIKNIVKNNNIELYKAVIENHFEFKEVTKRAALKEAVKYNRQSIINYILKEKTDLSFKGCELLKVAVDCKHLELLKKLLLELKDKDITTVVPVLVKKAIRNGDLKIYKFLDKNFEIDPNWGKGNNFVLAIHSKNEELINELLKNKNLDVPLAHNQALKVTLMNKNYNLAKRLLNYKNVKENVNPIFLSKLPNTARKELELMLKINNF